MRVHILQADQGGSGFYRVSEVARAVNEAGLGHVTYSTEMDVEARAHKLRGVTQSIEVLDFDDMGVDLFVVQRPLAQQVNSFVKLARSRGIPVVVDVDDDFHSVHPDNVAGKAVDPKHDRLHNRDWLWDTCLNASALTVSTPHLTKYGRPGRAQVVRNYLPERIFQVRPNRSANRVVGWTGTVATHPTDLQATRGALAGLAAPFIAVGDPTGVARALNIDPATQTFATLPWSDSVESYWQNIRDTITIGIAPLEVSRFNKAKSWLKGLEYAALGIPFVASPLPEYMRLCKELDCGTIATSRNQWRAAIDRLLADDEFYTGRVYAGLNAALDLTLEGRVKEWVSVWAAALDQP